MGLKGEIWSEVRWSGVIDAFSTQPFSGLLSLGESAW